MYVVLSDSSAPSYLTGDFVIIDTKFPITEYQTGDAILYQSALRNNIIIIHKIYDIQIVNNTQYIAIKGDANPQPDLVTPIPPVFNRNHTSTITWDFFYPGTENPETEIIISYFPAEQVVLGKVVTKIPILGWLFVPFNSPVGDPFEVLPISLFSMFFAYFIIVGIGSLFYLIYRANQILKEFLGILQFDGWMTRTKFRIKVPGIYSLLLIPLIVFEITFFTALPTPITINSETTLNKSDLIAGPVPYWNLEYTSVTKINSLQLSQLNTSLITIQLWNQTDFIIANFSKLFNATGTGILPSSNYQIIEHEEYTQTIDKRNLYIISSNNNSDPNVNKFFEYAIPIQNQAPIGLMTRNTYLIAEISEFNNISAYRTYIDYSFIQELITVNWQVTAYFEQSTGFLLYLKIVQTEGLWAIPEMITMLITAILILFYYEFIRFRIQKEFDKHHQNILKNQENEQISPILINNEE